MADTKGQVDWQALAKKMSDEMDVSEDSYTYLQLLRELRTTFEPLVKAAEQACKTLQIYEDYDARALRAALDGLPKVGG